MANSSNINNDTQIDSYVLENLKPGATYNVQVRSISGGQASEWSNIYNFTTPTQPIVSNNNYAVQIMVKSSSVVGGALIAGAFDSNSASSVGGLDLSSLWNGSASISGSSGYGGVVVNSTGILGYKFDSADISASTAGKFFLSTADGNAYFRGTIYGTSGNIGGWTIGSNSLYNNSSASSVGLTTGSIALYAGSVSTSASLDPFRLSNTGTVIIDSGVGQKFFILGKSGAVSGSISFGAQQILFGNSSIPSSLSMTYADDGTFTLDNGSYPTKITNTGGSLELRSGQLSINSTGISPTTNIGTTTNSSVINIGATNANTYVDGVFYTGGRTDSSVTNEVSGQYFGTYTSLNRDASVATSAPVWIHKFNSTGTLTGNQYMIRLHLDGADQGYIYANPTTAPGFGGTSDYRLKDDIQDFKYASEIIKKTRLRSFKWKKHNEYAVGFIAHELAESSPDFVYGQKDEVDEEGNPSYQTVMVDKLIPYLTGALKEAILEIENLNKRITDLEAKMI